MSFMKPDTRKPSNPRRGNPPSPTPEPSPPRRDDRDEPLDPSPDTPIPPRELT